MMETFIQFQLSTSARRSETLGLFWDRINWERRTAFVPTSKNGRPHHLSLRADVMALLKQLPRTSDVVFDIPLKTLIKAWRRICEVAGIEDLRIHDLRHEGISRIAESGLFKTVLDLQAYSGHRDLRSLSRYTHLNTTSIAQLAEQAEVNRLEKMEHNGRLRLKKSTLTNLGGATDTVRGSPLMLDAEHPLETELPSNVVVFEAFQRASRP